MDSDLQLYHYWYTATYHNSQYSWMKVFADMAQLKNIEKVSVVDDPAALGIIYDSHAD